MSKAVFLDLESIDQEDLNLDTLKSLPYEWQWYARTREDQLLERIQDAEVVISNKVVLERDLLSTCGSLKLICIAATGTNNVDLAAARDLGISVANVTAYATPSVVQHVFTLILALSTRLLDYRQAVNKGAWQQSNQFCLLDYPISEISGRRLGILGYGELGQGVAAVARAFGMEVLIAQRPGTAAVQPDRLPLDELLPRVDILSLHCPLTPATRNIIDRRALGLMKPDALLINTARGGIVDEQALKEALMDARLGGAGMDVLSEEPPVNGNPLLGDGIPNLILTPHTAWASRESRQRLINEVAENITAHRQQRKRNLVVVKA